MKNKKLLLMVALSCAAGHGLHTFAAAEATEKQKLEWAYESGDFARAQQILNSRMVSVQDAQWVLGRLLHFVILGNAFDESREQVADLIKKYIQERTDQEVAQKLQQKLQDEDQAAARERKQENQQREESDALIAQSLAAMAQEAAEAMRRGRAASPAAEEKEAEAVAHAFSFPMAPGGPGWAQQEGASCPACTFINQPGAAKCELCDNPFK